MKLQSAWVLGAAVMSVSLGACLMGCADQSAPNRRGMERPPLVGNGGLQNADKRELEAPKRDLPTGAGKEFPGQTAAPAYIAPGSQPMVYLDVVVMPQGPAAPATAGAVNPAGAVTAPAAVLENAPATAPVPPLCPVPTTGPAAGTGPGAMATSKSCNNKKCCASAPKPNPQHYGNDNKPYATPGKAMPVAGTGMVIPPEWGEPTVMASYPHRPWADTSVTYQVGTTWHDPTYFRPLFDRGEKFNAKATPSDKGVRPGCPTAYQQDMDLGIASVGNSAGVMQDLCEFPWFVGQTLALPILMILDRPLDQHTTRPAGKDSLYLGQLPPGGPAMPAAQPGEVRYVYPLSTTQPDMPPDSKP